MQDHHYVISTRLDGLDVVLAMAATPAQAVSQFEALGGSVSRDAWVIRTLAGRERTTDGYPSARAYTAGNGRRFLRVEHEPWSPDLVQSVHAFQRQARADEAPSAERRRTRLRS